MQIVIGMLQQWPALQVRVSLAFKGVLPACLVSSGAAWLLLRQHCGLGSEPGVMMIIMRAVAYVSLILCLLGSSAEAACRHSITSLI